MTFVPDTAALNRLLHSPTGMVGRYLERTGDRVRLEAEALCPVGEGKDGHLAASIVRTAPTPTSDGQMVRVGSRKRYAAAVVRGAKPHIITPRNASVLHFVAEGGGDVFTTIVHHPGNKGRNFLMAAARRIIGGRA